MSVPNYRVFDGKRYERSGAMYKPNANAYARRVKEAGRLARVVKYHNPISGMTHYYVYTRNK